MIVVVNKLMRNLKRIRYRIFYLLIIVAAGAGFLSSCRSLGPVVTDEVMLTGDDIYSKMNTNLPDVKTYSASRMMINIIDDNREMNLRGSVRIKRDSAILISVNAFAGIEAVRLLFTPDSVKMIDRINRSFFSGNYEESRRFIPYALNLEILQNIFFASPLKFSDEIYRLEGSNEEYEFDEQLLNLRFSVDTPGMPPADENNDIVQIVLDSEFLTRKVDFYSDRNDVFASLQYNSYLKLTEHVLPDEINLSFVSHNIPLKAGLRLRGIEINEPVEFPFNIPSGYSRLNY